MKAKDYTFSFPVIVGTILAYVILFVDNGGNSMVAGLWAIAVAVVSLLGSTWFQYANSKKDMKPLSGIQSTTSEMKPRVEHIDANTKELNDKVLREMYPDLKNIASDIKDSKKDLSYVQNQMEYEQRLKQEYSAGFEKDSLTAGIDKIYEKNAKLEQELRERKQEYSKIHNMNLG